MKLSSLVFFLISCLASIAAPALPSVPNFSDRLTARPPLTLSEAIRSGDLPPVDDDTKRTLEWIRSPVPKETRYVSRMPVIAPDQGVGREMAVIAPKTGTDFKGIVQEPKIESTK